MRVEYFIRIFSGAAVAALIACAAEGPRDSAIQPDLDARRSAPTSANPGAPIGSPSLFQSPAATAARESGPVPTFRPPPASSPLGADGVARIAAEPGDPRRGRAFALDNCRPCHVVAADQGSPVRFANAPDFRTIAGAAQTTRLGLALWLTNPHPTMPTLVLAPDEAANVIAYILGLRDQKEGRSDRGH
jgi:mono/diheme cytochrome c family protein